MRAKPAEPTAPGKRAARRFLITAAVTDVRAHPEAERAELADDVRRMDDLFLGELGYHRGVECGLNPTGAELRDSLRAFATDPARHPDDYVVLYLAAHGVTDQGSGRHYLLLHDSDARDLYGTALPTEDLVARLWDGTAIERLLVLIDACYAEEGADRALRAALEARRFRDQVTDHGSTGLVVVSSSRRKEESYTGALSAAFDRAVRGRATVGHAPAHISLAEVMSAIQSDPRVPPAQRPSWSITHATGDIPAFLPNHRHLPDSAGLGLEEIDRIVALGARERDAREQDMRGFFLPRARGTDVPAEAVWDFTGRHVALGDLTTWLDPRRTDERLCVVTGDPGSGKSSLLGMVAVLTDRERGAAVPRAGLPSVLPRPGDVDERINASHLSTRQLLDALAAASGCAAESLGALTAHLQTRTRPLVVLVDSLDEALAPHESVEELLAPLTDPERRLPLRLLIGSRPHIAARLPAAAPRIDLDSERYGDPDAIRAYTRKLLCTPGSVLVTAPPHRVDEIAEAVGEAAGRSFLVARITARTIAREPRPPDPYDQRWREELPRLPGEAMERDLTQQLGPLAGRARDLLLPLAYAQGAGLPWAGVWPRLASALTGRDYRDDDIVWLRKAAGSYVVEGIESGGSVYRVYHRALVEYLREGSDTETVQRTVTEVLRDVEHPYVRRYLALHAAEGAVLDPLVQDAEFVLGAEPGQLLAGLPGLRTAEGRRAGQAVRDLEEVLRKREGSGADPEARARLRLAAVCRKAATLADSCDMGEGELPWRARWAAWNPHEGARRYEGMTIGLADGLVVPDVRGAWYLDLTSRFGSRWQDLHDGGTRRANQQTVWWYRDSLTAVPQLSGMAAALWADGHVGLGYRLVKTEHQARLLHLWSGMRRQTWVLQPSPAVDPPNMWRAPESAVQLVLLGGADGEPLAAVLRLPRGRLLVYRLGSTRLYPPLTRRQRRPLWRGEAEKWAERADLLASDLELILTPDDTGTRVTSCAAPSGLGEWRLLLGHEDGRVTQFAPLTGEFEDEVTTGHDGSVTHVDLVTDHPQGRFVVTAGTDRSVRLSSLTRGVPVRTLLAADSAVVSLAVRRVGRQWIVAVATVDGQLHRVDLDSGRPVGLPLRVERGSSVRLEVFSLGPTACVSVQGSAHGLQVYDLVTGDRVGGQVFHHAASTVRAVGGTVCVGGSDGNIRFWPTPDAADSVHVTAHQRRVLALGEIRGPSGRPAVVSVGEDHEIRCWDLARPHELWRRPAPDPGPWQVPLIACATTGRTADGRDYVVTGEHGGRVTVLVLRDGLPVAEQEFTVPDIVTALTTGRVRGRDVLVVGTDSGRVACWDVGAARMFVYGPLPATPVWTGALALAPDGSGRLAVGGTDGSVREWSLPTCRPLTPARRAHRGPVSALAYTATGLVGYGTDTRLVSYGDGWERRMPQPGGSLHATGAGLLCGDDSGDVWLVRDTPDGRKVTEAVDRVRPVTAVAAVLLDDGLAVAAAGSDGSLRAWDGARGTPLRRLNPVGQGDAAQLAAVAWRSPGRDVRPRLFARGTNGLLQYWDFGTGDPVRSTGLPLVTPAPHHHEAVRLAVLPDEAGAQSLLSLAVWDEQHPDATGGYRRGRLSVHDVAEGSFLDLPCSAPGDDSTEFQEVRAVRCAGRVLVFVPFRDDVVRVLDTTTGHWASLWLRDDYLVDVFALPTLDDDELLLVGGYRTRIIRWETLRPLFTTEGHPARHRSPGRRRLPHRRPAREPEAVHQHGWQVIADRAALLSGGDTYAVAGDTDLAVVGARTGEVHRALELPSPCTALTAGPRGELIVGTRNGLILFD
ncbi:caspase family protein [Streptomyces sp. NBC_00989]|uniref:caspase family protein n=1 Tax=Streptomyces sp. NBC_00989 TaxID=2903705 RepID=UPI00386F22ED|nr:caspase family protein [Streptomyces sp. NBC_00989]